MQILTRCAFQINAPTSSWSQGKLEKFGSLPKDFSTFRRSSLRYHETPKLTTGNDVHLGMKQFSNSTNALTLQSISTFCTGIEQGQCEILVCRKLLKERERYIPGTTLMIKSLAFGQIKPNGGLSPKHHILFVMLFSSLTYISLFLSHFDQKLILNLKTNKKDDPPNTVKYTWRSSHLPLKQECFYNIGSDNFQPYFWP